VLVIDEYLAIEVLVGDWPPALPDDEPFALPASRHFRLLQRIHQPSGGQLSSALERLSPAGRLAVRNPHPEVFQVLDPRPLLDDAARIGARYATGGLLIVETLAAGLSYGKTLWFGKEANIGRRLAEIARDLGIAVQLSEA
jgi:class 3 adenylate cyclase